MGQHRNKKHPSRQHHENHQVSDGALVADEVQLSAEEREYRDAQKSYWQRQLKIARWLNWITACGTLVGLGSLLYLYGTLGTTRDAANAANQTAKTAAEQLDVSERPWVRLVAIDLAQIPAIDKSGLHFVLRLAMQNSGHSPAANIRSHTDVHVFGALGISGTATIEKQRTETCKKAELTLVTDFPDSVIFPDTNTEPVSITLGVPQQDVEAAVKEGSGGFLMPLITYCVVYKSTFNDAIHRTAYVFNLDELDSSTGQLSTIRVENGSVKPGRFYLTPGDSVTAN